MSASLRRSLLYTPLSSDSMLEKAGTRGADVLIFDLEDGVLPEAKETAREKVRRIPKLDCGRAERFVRVNGTGTPWHESDLLAVRDARLDAIILPKAETAEAV